MRSRFSGIIITAHAHEDGRITLDFPAAPGTGSPLPEGPSQSLGARPQAAFRTGAPGDLLTVLPDGATVRALKPPDLDVKADMTRREVLRGVILTAHAPSPDLEYDFVLRFSSPAEDIYEDPVMGSARTAPAPAGRPGWTATSSPGRRRASARTGLVRTAVQGDRVHLIRRAVTVLDGTLHV